MIWLKRIFIFLLFLVPLGEIIRIDFGNGLVIRPLDLGVVSLVIVWALKKIKNKEAIEKKSFFWPIIAFIGFAVFSLIINIPKLGIFQLFISSMYLFRWIFYAGVLFVVSDFDQKFKGKIVYLLNIFGIAIIILGFVQYIFYSDLRNLIYLGWDDHMHRMFSVFFDPNFAGAFFVLFFLFEAYQLFNRKNILQILTVFITLVAIFLTFSRSALLMLIVGSSLLFWYFKQKKLIFGIILAILIFLALSFPYFKLENVNPFRKTSTQARLKSISNALVIIQDNPIFGVGFNAYRYAQFRYNLRDEATSYISHADAGTDNSFLFVFATTGILGLASFMFMWLKILRSASPLAKISILGIFVSSLFINSLFYPFIMLWLWILIGL